MATILVKEVNAGQAMIRRLHQLLEKEDQLPKKIVISLKSALRKTYGAITSVERVRLQLISHKETGPTTKSKVVNSSVQKKTRQPKKKSLVVVDQSQTE